MWGTMLPSGVWMSLNRRIRAGICRFLATGQGVGYLLVSD